jgi:phosphohistidine phosphatase SixA
MILYLVRHGEAARPSPDQSPSLTTEGRTQVALVAQKLLHKNLKIEALWHSPLDRAAQTAGILAKILLIPRSRTEVKEELSPEGAVEAVYRAIAGQKAEELLIVSHLPFLDRLVLLMLGDSSISEASVFPTAGVSAFEFEKKWKWLWSLDPFTAG